MSHQGLSVPQGAALTIGAVLGTGVISLPAIASEEAGPASLLAWGGLLLLSIPMAATFAALGGRYPDAGGVSTYARIAFGRHLSTMVGWAFYLTICVGAPVAAGFAGAYVADSLGAGHGTELLVAALTVCVVTGLNWFGIQLSARTQLTLAGVIAALLAITILTALPHVDGDNLTPFAPHGAGSIVSAAAALMWAFAGWEVVGSLSAEYRNPRRDIPRSTAIALVAVSVLYIGIAFATVAVLGSNPGDAPLSDLLVLEFGEVARPVTTVLAVLLTLGAMNAYFAGGSRLAAALARDGGMPARLASGHGKGEIPRPALALMSTVALGTIAVLALLDEPTDALLLVATGTFSFVYLVGAAAALKLLPRRSLNWWCAALSVVAAVLLMAATREHVLGPITFALAGLAWSLAQTVRQRRATRPRRRTPTRA